MKTIKRAAVLLAAALAATAVNAAPTLMSPEWAKGMCEAWKADPTLTTKLLESGWIKNDKGRGYKIMADLPRRLPGQRARRVVGRTQGRQGALHVRRKGRM